MRVVRELVSSDTEAFRDLRLEALRLHPDAFSSAYESEAAEPISAFAARIAKGGVFGAFAGDGLQGMAGFYVHASAQQRHKGTLWGMYVRESSRGCGLAEAIVNAVLEHASKRVEQVLLTVASSNQRALRLYERMGFTAYATEPRALKVGQRYIDEVLMIRLLTE